MNRTIELIIKPDGTLKMDALGFEGRLCEEATRFLEDSLGRQTEQHRKPEYHKPVRRTRTVRT